MLRQPASLMTREVLSGLRDFKRLPHDSWYFIAGATLSTLNRPDEGARVLKFALNNGKDDESSSLDPQESLRISRRMREAMVKLAAISGLPKTINSLFALKSVTPRECLDDPLAPSATLRPVQIHDIPTSQILQKGQRFFDSIYGKISKRVMGQMDRSGTEDLGLMARLMYGYILSNVSILTPAETSYVLIAGLIPQDVNPQLKGHLKGALNNGAKESEVRAVRDMVLQICRMYGMKSLECEDPESYGWRKEVANL